MTTKGADVHETSNLNRFKPTNLVGDIEIGKYCAIARNVVLHGTDHKQSHASIQGKFYQDHFNQPVPKKTEKIKIGNDVWIGRGATILKNVEIGNGAIIGAESVVTKDVEPYEIVAGNPAKHVGWRFENKEKRELLNNLKWWDWNEEKIQRNEEFFMSNLKNKTVKEIKQMVKK